MPVAAHIKKHPVYFHRFDVLWTPTVLILESKGIERERSEGYLPNSEFRARLEMGLARIAFMHKQWAEAERKYAAVAERYPNTSAAPEAIYWRGVSRYKATNDHMALGKIADELKEKYQGSVWDAQGFNLVSLTSCATPVSSACGRTRERRRLCEKAENARLRRCRSESTGWR